MLCIVAHHYVVNSGILEEINPGNALSFPSLFVILFGWGGKTGINCFLLITGYFMCRSEVTIRKFLKLVMEVEFYKILIYLVFLVSGYTSFSMKELVKAILPIYGIGTGFTGSFLVFYLFIPYLNKLIHTLDKHEHLMLVGLCLLTGSILQTFLKAPAAFTYVGWFMVMYLIASYIRLYPKSIFESRKMWGTALAVSLLLCWGSVVAGLWVYSQWGKAVFYYFVADSNKILTVVTAVSAFLFFKNLRLSYHPFINMVSLSAFGVLQIHANSDMMRQWLWKDVLNNVAAYSKSYLVLHAIGSVLGVYTVCTLADQLRIRFLEKPFFDWYDRKWENV